MKRNQSRASWNPAALFAALMAAAFVMISAAPAALAGAMVNKVWFPDGQINWAWVEAPVPPDTNQHLAFGYIGDHTPLRINQTDPPQNSSERKSILQLRWSGGDWNVARGYWKQDGGDGTYNYSLAFSKPEDWTDTGAIDYGFWVDGVQVSPPPTPEPSVETILHEFGHALGFAHEFQRDERDRYVTVSGVTDVWNFDKLKTWLNLRDYRNLSPFDHASVMNKCYIVDANDPDCGVNSSRHVNFIDIPAESAREYKMFVSGSQRLEASSHTNLLSVHDINSIYRVYARPLGNNQDGDDFGHSVATGDFDHDGLEDIAVATTEEGASADRQLLKIHLYRGVALPEKIVEPSNMGSIEYTFWVDGEQVTTSGRLPAVDLHHVPWLSYTLDLTDDAARHLVLAAGDFNGDEIDDLAVGDPGFDANSGRVFVVFFNQAWEGATGPCDGKACAPWGNRSVLGHHVIFPEDVGLAAGEPHRFGAALAVADVTKKRKNSTELRQRLAEDLLIGAPGAFQYDPLDTGLVVDSLETDLSATGPALQSDSDSSQESFDTGWVVNSLDTDMSATGPEFESSTETPSQSGSRARARLEDGGAVVVVRPNIMAKLRDHPTATSLNWQVANSKIVWNPGTPDAEFGAAIGRIPSFCDAVSNGWGVSLDGFAVGAPGEGSDAGAVYYYDCAVDSDGNWIPSLTEAGSRLHPTASHRYGASVKGFSTTQMELTGCTTDHHIVAGAPRHPAENSSLRSGRVYLHSIDHHSNMHLVTTLRPVSTVSGDDLFGAALAVHQEPSEQCLNSAGKPVGGRHVEVAVGMPGNAISGNASAGRVYIWNPWSTDGTINHNSVIKSPSPALPETRFGHALATVRNLTEGGGFVIGAPGGFGGFDYSNFPAEFKQIASGFIQTELNQDFSTDFAWLSYTRTLSQSSGADRPPTNLREQSCGLGFEAAVVVPILMRARRVLARHRMRRRSASEGA